MHLKRKKSALIYTPLLHRRHALTWLRRITWRELKWNRLHLLPFNQIIWQKSMQLSSGSHPKSHTCFPVLPARACRTLNISFIIWNDLGHLLSKVKWDTVWGPCPGLQITVTHCSEQGQILKLPPFIQSSGS